MEIEASKLRGRNVLDARGNLIGKVDDVTFDPATWTVESLVVDLDREAADDLNVKRRMGRDVTLAVTRQRVATVGDAVLLNVNRDDLATLLRRASQDEGP